jgi:hypothetical protein
MGMTPDGNWLQPPDKVANHKKVGAGTAVASPNAGKDGIHLWLAGRDRSTTEKTPTTSDNAVLLLFQVALDPLLA